MGEEHAYPYHLMWVTKKNEVKHRWFRIFNVAGANAGQVTGAQGAKLALVWDAREPGRTEEVKQLVEAFMKGLE